MVVPHIPRPMAILTTLLIALLVLVCLLMVLIILMQRPKQEGLGAAFGGGMTDSMFGAQTTDVLQKGTTWLAVIFFCTTIALASIKTREFQAEAEKGENLISNDPVETTPALQPQMPDLSQPAFDPSIPLPGAADGAGAGGAEAAPTSTPDVGLLPPPDAVDASKPTDGDKPKTDDKKPAPSPAPAPGAADKKPAATPKAEAGADGAAPAKPAAEAKSKPAATTAPAAEKKPAPAPKPTPAPAADAEADK